MEKKVKKKKFTLKKIKKIISNVFKKIAESIKKIGEQFMSLPSHIRKITYVWTIVILLLLILAVASNKNTEYIESHAKMEEEMSISALDYVKSNDIIPGEDNKLRLDLNVLKDFNYIYDDVLTDKTCEGFSLVYYSESAKDYVISSYINCKNYTTKGYSDYK